MHYVRMIRRRPMTLKVAACLLPIVSGAGAAPALAEPTTDLQALERVRVLPAPKAISDRELLDTAGKPFRLEELKGRVSFVFFGFTNCPDVCPIAMQNFRLVHESGRLDNERVNYVLISVDGERDTPEVMAEYIALFSPDFVGLTADPAVVRKVTKEFRASFYRENADDSGDYSISHSPQAFVLDEQGRLRAELYNAPLDSMVGIAEYLLGEGA